MARTTGPLLSFDASGSVGGAIVFSKWKGRNYVRQLVIPSNPKSPLQIGVRSMMKFLSQAWAALTPTEQGSWQTQADAIVASPFNAYTKLNMDLWGRNLPPTQDYPYEPATDGVNLASLTATGGIRSATIVATTGTNTDSWGIVICRSTTMGFSPSRANAIAVLPAASATAVEYLDTPLDPGTYYYRAMNFNDDGEFGAYIAEEDAVVT